MDHHLLLTKFKIWLNIFLRGISVLMLLVAYPVSCQNFQLIAYCGSNRNGSVLPPSLSKRILRVIYLF